VAALAYAQTNPNQQTGKDDKIAHDQHAHEKAEVDRNRADYAVLVLIHDSNSPADNVVSRIWLALKPGSRVLGFRFALPRKLFHSPSDILVIAPHFSRCIKKEKPEMNSGSLF
jgi:hypothetical protein